MEELLIFLFVWFIIGIIPTSVTLVVVYFISKDSVMTATQANRLWFSSSILIYALLIGILWFTPTSVR